MNVSRIFILRPVVEGPATRGEAAIASGLGVGEQVVTDGVDKLRAGAAVKLREPDTTARETSAAGAS